MSGSGRRGRETVYCALPLTPLPTEEGWLYLAVVIDLYSRQVVGWSMSERMKATLVCDALTMALFRRGRPRGVIVHSDRGSQYCSKRYRRLVEKHELHASMSKRGDCFDNALCESFFATLECELLERSVLRTIAVGRLAEIGRAHV